MLLWLSSVCWARTLDTPKWDILVTDVAAYFDSKLRQLKLQTYPSISPAKVREKPPDNAENGENGVWREGKFPSSGTTIKTIISFFPPILKACSPNTQLAKF